MSRSVTVPATTLTSIEADGYAAASGGTRAVEHIDSAIQIDARGDELARRAVALVSSIRRAQTLYAAIDTAAVVVQLLQQVQELDESAQWHWQRQARRYALQAGEAGRDVAAHIERVMAKRRAES